jgi:hypothetical protein
LAADCHPPPNELFQALPTVCGFVGVVRPMPPPQLEKALPTDAPIEL